MSRKLPEFTVIKDTREQDGWDFEQEEKVSGRCQLTSVIETKLDTGDYSIFGLEEIFTIERKAGFSELFGNLGNKTVKDRFEREMERMGKVPHSYILIESVLDKDVLKLGVPQMARGMPAGSVLNDLITFSMDYNVHFLFVGNAGKSVARRIMEQVVRKYRNQLNEISGT
jgi:hypothetical protein